MIFREVGKAGNVGRGLSEMPCRRIMIERIKYKLKKVPSLRKHVFLLVITLVLSMLSGWAWAAVSPFGELNEIRAKQLLQEVGSGDVVAGIYQLTKGTYKGNFLVIPNDASLRPEAKYIGVVIDSSNEYEKSGYVRFWLIPREAPTAFSAEYYNYGGWVTNKIEGKAYLTTGALTVYIQGFQNTNAPNMFFKIYP
jgi:hypothetical protein